MKAIAGWFRDKKKLIAVIALVVLLIVAVFLLFGDGKKQSSLSDSFRSDTELRLVALLESMDGVGDAEVMVTENDGDVTGVVVVCDGANSIVVRNDILNAVSTALDINKNIIAIYSM